MPEEASMSFKVYLDLGGGRQEVRRFGLPETIATSYSVLKDKICNIFGLSVPDAVLSWKDAEGDSITISSDDELMEAVADSVSNQNAQLIRINVVESSGRQESGSGGPQGNQQGDIHVGVTCDACNGKVQGFRYKCVSCPDFDLCGACETKGHHKEHRMMRLPKPQDGKGPWFYWKENEDGPGVYTAAFGLHGNDGNGSFSSSSFNACGGGGGGGGGWWGFGGPRGRHCRRGHGGRGRGNWPNWWGRGWGGRHWMGCGQAQNMNAECGGQQQQQQQQSTSNQSQQQQSQQQQQQQTTGNCSNDNTCSWMGNDEAEMPSHEQVAEEAKLLAEQVAQQAAQQAHHFASHFASEELANVMKGIWKVWSGQQQQQGINANTTTSATTSSSTSSTSSSSSSQSHSQSAAGGEKSKEAGQSNGPSQYSGEEYLRDVGETVANMLDPLGIDVEVAVEHNGIRQRCSLGETTPQNPPSSTQSNTSPAHSTPPRESSPPSLASAGSVNMEVQTDTTGVQALSKEVESMEVASPAPEPPQGGETMEGHASSPDTDDWMLVNQEASGEATGEASASASSSKTQPQPENKTVSYPSLVELTPHPDPKIQRALEHMSAMGYNNDGGWLTNLLEMKQGDINQVLDLLQPVNK